MGTFFVAFVAASYVTEVVFFALLTLAAFDKHAIQQLFGDNVKLRNYLVLVECLTAVVSETALHMLVLKWFLIQVVHSLGGFSKWGEKSGRSENLTELIDYTMATLAYFVDVINFFAFIILFYQSLQEKEIIEEAIKCLTGGDPIDPVESILR